MTTGVALSTRPQMVGGTVDFSSSGMVIFTGAR
jgi:hypothetical protein